MNSTAKTSRQVLRVQNVLNSLGSFYSRLKIAKTLTLLTALMLPFAFTTSCKHSPDDLQADKVAEVQLQSVIDAMGGKEAITSVNSISYEVNSKAYEWDQTTPVEPDPVFSNETNYKFTAELGNRKLRYDLHNINHDKPFQYPTGVGKFIINDKVGSIIGEYHWLSYYFGRTTAAAIYPSRIEAMIKTQKMANPIEMIKEILQNRENKINLNEPFKLPTRIAGLNIEMLVDPVTNLPKGAKIMEEDFLKGDVIFEVNYSNWVKVGNTKYPALITYSLNGQVLRNEILSDIALNPTLPANTFVNDPVDIPISYNKENADHGFIFSQWHLRWIAWGILIDQPLDNGALVLEKYNLAPFNVPPQRVGDNLKIIGRPDLRTWSVALKTSEGIYVVESPLNTFWTKSIIKAIEDEFPGQPLLATISTHTHHVSFGGIRELAARTGKVYVGADGAEFTRRAIAAKRTLVPDALTTNPRNVDVIPVTTPVSLANGAVQIYSLKTNDPNPAGSPTSGPHSTDMVVVYVPEYKALIQADMLWTGEYMLIWYNQSTRNFTPKARAELKRRANYLMDFIQQKGLDVQKIISIHGGVADIRELRDVAYN